MKSILALIVSLAFCVPSFGATVFSGSSQSVSMGSHTVLDIPNGDWTIAVWVQFSSRSGTGWDNIFEYRDSSENEFIIVRVSQASQTNPNRIELIMLDTNGHFAEFDDAGTFFASNTSPASIVVRRSGTTYSVWANGISVISSTDATAAAITPTSGVFYYGNENENPTKFFHGQMWDTAKWDRALRDDEVASLAKGFSADCFPNGQKWFYPMGGQYGYYKEMLVPVTVTNSSTTTSDAQRIIYCN